jgi:hypothetical protein
MLTKLFTTTVRYTVNGSDTPVATFGESRAVESLCGQDAVLDYCERRANGAEQLDAFLASLGRYFIGKPEHLTKCAVALETTAAYFAAHSDAIQRIEAARKIEEKRLTDELADLNKPKPLGMSDEAAADLSRGMREYWAREAASGGAVLVEHSSVPEDGYGPRFHRNGQPA